MTLASFRRWGRPGSWLTGAGLLSLALCLSSCRPGEGSPGNEESDPNIQTGQLLRQSGEYTAAEDAFLRALRNNPNSGTAHYELGLLYYEKTTNYAGALYHFQKCQGLRPRSRQDELLKLMMDECKRELSKDVPLGSISLQLQRDIDRLTRTNAALLKEIEQLKLQLAYRPPAFPQGSPTNPPPGTPLPLQSAGAGSPSNALAGVQSPAEPLRRSQVAARTHVVRPGETLAAIARRYQLDLDAVVAANPGIEPRRLQPGQTVRLPSR